MSDKKKCMIPNGGRPRPVSGARRENDAISFNKNVRGVIKSFYDTKGFGFIVIGNKDVFFHVSNLSISEEYLVSELKKKCKIQVLCKVVEGKKGPEAVDINRTVDVGSHCFVLNEEGKIEYFLDCDLERKRLQTFCNGMQYALSAGKIIEKDTVTTTDVVTLFENGEIDELRYIDDSDELVLKLNRKEDNYFVYLNDEQFMQIVQWQNIDRKEDAAEVFAKENKGFFPQPRSYKLSIDNTKTKAVLSVSSSVAYNERYDYNTEKRVEYYGTLYEDMFSKSATYDDMYKMEYDYEHFREEYEFVLENGISELLEQVLHRG